MRDLVITIIVVWGCVLTLKKPYIGILLWSWLSYMNPHRLSWGFAYDMPFAQITALTLFVSIPFSKSIQRFPVNNLTLTWIFFIVLMGITTLFAYFPEDAFLLFKRVFKIQLVALLTMMVITRFDQLKQLVWVVVLSIGYFSIKGGLFTLLTAGSYRVWGPEESFIADNNSLAVAVLMIIPLMVYLLQANNHKWVRYGLLAGIVTSLFTIVGSQSRGAFLAIVAVGFFYWLKTKNKLVSGMVAAALAVALLMFAPDSWYERMDTMNNYQEDASSMGRINAWHYAINAANDNLFGVGLDAWSSETFSLYAPDPDDVHAAHSIYFSVLADHGWIGLIMFVLIFHLAWKKLAKIIKTTDKQEQHKEVNALARMLQVSFIAYLVGGAFLSLSYYDLPWHLVSFVVILERLVNEKIQAAQWAVNAAKTSRMTVKAKPSP